VKQAKTASFPAPGHDHDRCLSDMRKRATEVFGIKGLRLTGLRQKVLDEIASSHHAIGAYDVLDRIARRDGTRLAPISVYRALDALVETGLVHRLESRNAFFACTRDHDPQRRQLVLACTSCQTVAEVEAEPVFQAIEVAASSIAFERTQSLVEVSGTCRHCAAASAGQGLG